MGGSDRGHHPAATPRRDQDTGAKVVELRFGGGAAHRHPEPSNAEIRHGPSQPEELRLRPFVPLLQYLKDHHGQAVCNDVAAAVGLSQQDLNDPNCWLAASTVSELLRLARELVADDEEFKRACVYRLRENFGPLVFLLRATSIRRLAEHASRTLRYVSRISQYEVLDSSASSLLFRYTSARPETRLICLSRQASIETMPTLWGLPSAQVEERSCIGWGDEACEYFVRWHAQVRRGFVVGGAALGVAVAALAVSLGLTTLGPFAVLPVLGASFAYAWELRRINKANLAFGEETNQSLREVAEAYAEANEEILDWNKRQRDWNRVLEARVAERTTRLEEIVAAARSMVERSETTLRSVSHDLRNPLTVLKLVRHEIEELVGQPSTELSEVLDDIDGAVVAMDRLILQLLTSARAESRLVDLATTELETRTLADRLRRRLKALALTRDIRVSVFCSREAPDTIECDQVLFDRVVDNLLSNAVKFTDRGSIVVELTGRPGFLTVKVSDTGPGISDEHIEKVFEVGESFAEAASPEGFGLGLSIVVRLLDEIGGKLEVMSKPGMGTTFWAHFPVEAPDATTTADSEDIHSVIDRVVTVRRLSGDHKRIN
jgi:signal transduction histidine kinase